MCYAAKPKFIPFAIENCEKIYELKCYATSGVLMEVSIEIVAELFVVMYIFIFNLSENRIMYFSSRIINK